MLASRYSPALAALVLACVPGWSATRPGDTVLIVTTAGVGAYGEALKGLRQGLAGASLAMSVAEVGGDRGGELRQRIERERPRLVVVIGSEAAAAVAAERLQLPVVGTMMLRAPASGPLAATTTLEVSLTAIIGELKRTFPGKMRLGILGGSQEAASSVSRDGFLVRYSARPGPDMLIEAFLTLKGQVDFVYCPPDPELFNPATIKPLILASLRNGLPLIGFSENFARAGAAASIYPDFEQVGRQTAQAVERILAGQTPGQRVEGPRKLRVAINEHVTRLLGLRHIEGSGPDLILIR